MYECIHEGVRVCASFCLFVRVSLSFFVCVLYNEYKNKELTLDTKELPLIYSSPEVFHQVYPQGHLVKKK